MRARSFSLTPEQARRVHADCQAALARIEAMVNVKFNFWSQLPWKLCGLSHWSPEVARACASACIQEYDLVDPDVATRIHHRLSFRFLDSRGPLRHRVDAYIETGTMH
eukprot:2144905-Alexandrium_andersonii.AAC.1